MQRMYHYRFKLAYESPRQMFYLFVVAWPLAQELTHDRSRSQGSVTYLPYLYSWDELQTLKHVRNYLIILNSFCDNKNNNVRDIRHSQIIFL